MNCRSIRLDFPADGLSISDKEVLILIQDCFIAAATSGTTIGRREAAMKLAKAASEARVERYDNRYGSPVFYVP
jgi:hypothetical protein